MNPFSHNNCDNECENYDAFWSSCKLLFYKTSISGKREEIHPVLEDKNKWLIHQVGCASYSRKGGNLR
jgi:hypothetical protein